MQPADSIIQDERFDPLRRNLTKFCQTAGIPERFVHHSMSTLPGVTEQEMNWIRHFKRNLSSGVAGYVLVGQDNPENRLMGAVGALLRNYVDARVITLASLLDYQEAGNVPQCTALMIPNLYTDAGAKGLPPWKVQIVYDILLSRLTTGKATFGYVESMEGLAKAYGKFFADHLNTHYTMVG